MVSPQPLKDSTFTSPPSVNQLIYQINNDQDFDDYILKNASKAPLAKSELHYVKHPTQAPTHSHPTPPSVAGGARRASIQMQNQPPPPFSLQQSDPTSAPSLPQVPPQSEPTQQGSFSTHAQPLPTSSHPQQVLSQQYGNTAYPPVAPYPYAQTEYPRGPIGQATAQQTSGVLYNGAQPPVKPVFGITLEDLFRRDSSPVPMVVYQCIQAVDLYGLEVEGIYRIPGTSSHIQQMKTLFDSGM